MRNFILFILIIFNCFLFGQTAIETPMYGKQPWSKKQKEINKKFISSAKEEHGNLKEASNKISKAGRNAFSKGDLKTGMKCFNQAWLLDSTNCLPYYGFSMVLLVTGSEAKALELLNSAKKFDSDNTGLRKYHLNLSFYYEYKNENSKLIDIMQTMIKIDTNFNYGYQKLAYLYSLNLDSVNALYFIKKAIQKDSKDSGAYLNGGWLYKRLKMYNHALHYYNQAIEIGSFYKDAYESRANLNHEFGLFSKAIEDYDKCISLESEKNLSYYFKLRAASKFELKDEGACKDLLKCIELMKKYNERSVKEIESEYRKRCK